MALQRIVIVGAGGMAREVSWLLRDLNARQPRYEFVGYVVSDLSRLGEHDSRDQVVGDLSYLEGASVDAVAIGIGTPVARARVGRELSERFPNLSWPALVHPSVQYDVASTTLGRGTLLCAGTVAPVNVVLDDFALVNMGCTVGHETRIGVGSVVNPGANVSGGVVIEDEVLVGTGAQILQYRRIGRGAIVGAGAVVTHDVLPHVTVVGIPARTLDGHRRA